MYPQIRTMAVDQITIGKVPRFNAVNNQRRCARELFSEHGFVWGQYNILTVSNSDKASVEDAPGNWIEFSINISLLPRSNEGNIM